MAKMKVLAGDFLQGSGEYHGAVLSIESALYPWPGISINTSMIRSIEVVGREENKDSSNAWLQGAAGSLLMGQPGAAVAGFTPGNGCKEVTFLATLKDGRKLLASLDEAAFSRLYTAHCTRKTIVE